MELWRDRTFDEMGKANEGCPSMTLYLLEEDGPHPVVVVCPGGGYVMRADHEGEPIARWLNSIGVSAVVLNYRVAPYRHPAPREDAQRAIRTVRYHAEAWRIDPARVGILGFSAGGHLASTVGTHYDRGRADAEDPVDRQSCRPDFLVLCYPVIAVGGGMNPGSTNSLFGQDANPDLVSQFSNHTQVTQDTPAAFLWHTSDDETVPVENVYLFASALAQHGVPHEVHVFERGIHGLGLATFHREDGQWTALCEAWLKARHIIKAYPRYSEDSTVRELLSHEAATAVIEKRWPGISTQKDLDWMKGFTLKHLSTMPEVKFPESELVAIAAELRRIED